MPDKFDKLFVRIPVENIKCKDSHEQNKLEKIISSDPERAVNYLEEALKDTVITISFDY